MRIEDKDRILLEELKAAHNNVMTVMENHIMSIAGCDRRTANMIANEVLDLDRDAENLLEERHGNIQYIKNANKTYPQWHDITAEFSQKFKGFHQMLCADGYNIKACNIAEKDGKLFWILLDENKENFKLEQYGFLKSK